MPKKYSMLLGRFQCIPPHEGHIELVRTLLSEGKNVLILIRASDGTEKNPYSTTQRIRAFEEIFSDEIRDGRVIIEGTVDVDEVCYGRTPGWGIREIILSEDLQKISATKKRNDRCPCTGLPDCQHREKPPSQQESKAI